MHHDVNTPMSTAVPEGDSVWISGAAGIFLLATLVALVTQFLPMAVGVPIQLVSSGAVAVAAAWVAVLRKPAPVWPTWLLAASQALLAGQALLLILTGDVKTDTTNLLIVISTFLQAVAWTRLGLGRGVGWNTAAVLDTAVIMSGLVGAALILGQPYYSAANTTTSTTQGIAAAFGIVLIGAISYGSLVRKPIPVAYQLILLGISISIVLRVIQVWLLTQGTDVSEQMSLSSLIIVTLATGAAVTHPSFADLGQARKPKPRSWSMPRAAALLGMAALPVWAVSLTHGEDDSSGLVGSGFMVLILVLLLTRAVFAGRAQEQLQERQRLRLTTDEVTGLPTRRGLLDLLEGEYAADPRHTVCTVVRVWLDDLDDLRETVGRRLADEVERLWSTRLINSLPPSAFVARLGPGEYAVVINGGRSTELALRTADAAIGGTTKVLADSGEEFTVRASMAAAPMNDITDSDFDDALSLAGIAHRTQGTTQAIGTHQMRQSWVERTALAQEVLSDHEWGGLRLHAQPFMRLADSTVAGYECLSHWISPTRGRVQADEFFRVVDALTLTRPIDLTIMKRALDWEGPAGGGPGLLSINVTPTTLLSGDSLPTILEAVEGRRWKDSTLWLEIIETDLNEPSTRLATILGLLAAEGIHIAVDDFGAGSSTLTRLADFHVTAVKLDRELVSGLDKDPRRRVIVKSMVGLSADLGMELLAEGIERAQDAQVLQDLGVTLGQGYLWAPAEPLSSAAAIGGHIPHTIPT